MSKLLILLPSLEIGGAEKLAMAQIKGLQAKGCLVFLSVLSEKLSPSLLQELALPDGNILAINTPYNTVSVQALKSAFANKKKLIAFSRQHHITHVLAHLPLAHIWGRLLKQAIPSLRLICYHHSLQYTANPLDTIFKKAFHRLNRMWSKKFDDTHIFISAAVQKDICRYLPVKDGHVIYNAVPDKWQDVKINRHSPFAKTNTTGIQLIIPGRLHPVKGHLFFLDVFQKLIHGNAFNLHLVIAGGGDLQQAIEEKITALQLQHHCTLTGSIDNEQLLQAMSESDLVVIPSVVEGLGIVAIEALMLGKTVLASDAGGLGEVIEDRKNGYLFKTNDQSQCLQKLRDIFHRFPQSLFPEQNQRNDYKKRFAFNTHLAQLLSVLKMEACSKV